LVKVIRRGDLDWTWKYVVYNPPPSYEVGKTPSLTLTLGAPTGSTTATASGNVFRKSDVDRIITNNKGTGAAVITGWTGSQTVVGVNVIETFDVFSPILSGNWTIQGSPIANIIPDKTSPVGAFVTVDIVKEQDELTSLLTNGDFSSPLATGWSDFSGNQVIIATGQHNGDTDSDFQLDDTNNGSFITRGVEVGHRVVNTSDGVGSHGNITSVSEFSVGFAGGLSTGNDNDFDPTDFYEIYETGYAKVDATEDFCRLHGGVNGTAWIEQSFATLNNTFYLVKFDVIDQPLSVMVGSTSQGSDVYSEVSFPVGNEQFFSFKAIGFTTYLQFRNNQDFTSILDNVSVRLYSIKGWSDPEDVGKYIKINNGIVQITDITPDEFKAVGIIRKTLFTDDEAIAGTWTLEESRFANNNNPSVVALFQERLWLNSASDPLRLFGSIVGDYENFAAGSEDDNSVEFVISADQVNSVQWMTASRTLNISTEGNEFNIQGSLGGPITPTSIDVKPISFNGSEANVKPIKIGNTILVFVQRGGQKLLALDFDTNKESQITNEITLLAKDLVISGIKDIAYQAQPDQIIWAITNDGDLLSTVFNPDQRVNSWAKHSLGGTVESIAVVPTDIGGRDQLWMVITRNVGGQDLRYIEFMDDHNSPHGWGSIYLDSALTYDSIPNDTFSGLDHLEGETVAVIADGADRGDFVVESGEITLPEEVSTVEVGLPFTARLKTLRPIIGNETVSGRIMTNSSITVEFLNTIGADIKDVDETTIESIPFRFAYDPTHTALQLFTGPKTVETIGDFEDPDATVIVESPRPYPCNILEISRFIKLEDDHR
jgi:hypothetical protein